MSNSPAGWYPQEDGRLRYWDGQNWTEHFAPGQAPSPMGATPSTVPGKAVSAPTAGPDSQSAAPRAPRPWFKKKRVLIPSGLLALAILGSALSGEDTETMPPHQPRILTRQAPHPDQCPRQQTVTTKPKK